MASWAALVTGADAAVCVWENAPRLVHTGTLVLLSEVSLAARGADGAEWAYAAAADPLAEFTPTASGSRVWTVQVGVEVHDQRAATSARHVAQRAVTRALWPRARALAVRGPAPVRAGRRPAQGRWPALHRGATPSVHRAGRPRPRAQRRPRAVPAWGRRAAPASPSWSRDVQRSQASASARRGRRLARCALRAAACR